MDVSKWNLTTTLLFFGQTTVFETKLTTFFQIQGTKIQDFSQAERDTVEGHTEESSSKDEEYEVHISCLYTWNVS